MIGLLDPALFLVRPESDVVADCTLAIYACERHGIELAPIEEYWPALWSGLIRELEHRLSPEGRRPLQELRKRAERSYTQIAPLTPNAGLAWRRGFTQMFGAPWLDPPWDERMALAALRAASTGRPIVLLTRRMKGRNLMVHAAGGTSLDEVTRWVLYVQPRDVGPRQVLCVYHPRNLTERWTACFDWRLPTTSDGARYPFCAPNRWWKGSTTAFRTVASRPAWIDAHNNAWARPNIPRGAGYHWDVFIGTHSLAQSVGLSQVNVVEFGAPDTEGSPGTLHHVPSAKAGRPTGTGWSCT